MSQRPPQWFAARRARLAKAGLCVQCGERSEPVEVVRKGFPTVVFRRCDVCREKDRRRAAKTYAASSPRINERRRARHAARRRCDRT